MLTDTPKKLVDGNVVGVEIYGSSLNGKLGALF